MRRQAFIFIAPLVLAGQLCQAHAHLVASVPAEGAVLTMPPQHLELNFSEPARLTALSVRRAEEKRQSLPLPSGGATQHVTLDLPKLAPGVYTLEYRVISADSHIASGTVHFTVSGDRAAAH
jgi:methionine-rich copper-binding protein CopC